MYLVLSLLGSLRILVRKDDAPGGLSAFDRVYREIEFPEKRDAFLGFYDWLRTADRRVVGVDLLLHKHCEGLQQQIPETSYARWIAPGILRILFEVSADIDDEASVDQEFLATRCYRAQDGAIALLFDADELGENDLRLLSGRT